MNSTNETFYSLDYWLDAFGYPDSLEKISIYGIIPISLISFLLNLFSFMILLKQCFVGSVFYGYMKLQLLNGAILSLVCLTVSLGFTHRLFNFTNTYESSIYIIYLLNVLQPVFYFYSSILEICVVIERSLYFLPRQFGKIRKISFNKFTFSLFVFSVIIHIPSFFFLDLTYLDVELAENTWFRIWYANVTYFSNTVIGLFFTYFQYLVRDILPLVIKIALNSILMYLVRAYVNESKKDNTANGLKTSTNFSNRRYISKTDRNQTYISLIMCILSLFEHMFFILSYILYYMNLYSDSNMASCLTTLFITIKHSFNILILYKFNNLFKFEFKRIFKLH